MSGVGDGHHGAGPDPGPGKAGSDQATSKRSPGWRAGLIEEPSTSTRCSHRQAAATMARPTTTPDRATFTVGATVAEPGARIAVFAYLRTWVR